MVVSWTPPVVNFAFIVYFFAVFFCLPIKLIIWIIIKQRYVAD